MDRLEQSEANKSLGARVVFLHGLPKDVVEAIISYTPNDFETTLMTSDHSLKEQIEIVSEADFLMVYRAELSDEVLRAASKCRLVQLLAAGYDSMNLGLMKYLGIPCANNGGANSWAVADHAVLLMLALYKKLVLADSATRGGNWNKPIDGQNTFELADKLVGVLGMGNIGRQVAKRVQAFDAIVQYYDAYPLSRMTEQELTVSRVSLKELFQTSDIVTCHTPLTAETYRLVNREKLSMMKRTAVMINTSRGPVVDEVALIEALSSGWIAGAGLDVFEEEPVDKGNRLLDMENVVVTPHMAGTTWNTWFRRAEFAYQNMERVWRGDSPQAIAQDFGV